MRRAVALVLSCLLTAAACGGDEGADRDDPMRVFHRTMAAVHDADWPTLRTLLTKEARMEMARDLERVKKRLAHPDGGKRERELAADRLGARAPEEIRKVVQGGPAAALRFWMLINPRERKPPVRGFEAGKLERKVFYATGDGTIRPVRLVRRPDGWYVADLQL